MCKLAQSDQPEGLLTHGRLKRKNRITRVTLVWMQLVKNESANTDSNRC